MSVATNAQLSTKEDAVRKCNLSKSVAIAQMDSRKIKQFDRDIMDRLIVVDATPDGKVVVDLDLDMRYVNGGGALHGAGTSAIFDCLTTLCFAPLLPDWTQELHNMGPPGGVTRALNVSYVRPVRLPGRIRVYAEVVSNGRSATLARATMTSPDGKKVYSTCEHHKIQATNPGGWSKPKSKL